MSIISQDEGLKVDHLLKKIVVLEAENRRLIEQCRHQHILFARAPFMQMVLDDTGHLVEVNESLLAALDYSPEELLGRELIEILSNKQEQGKSQDVLGKLRRVGKQGVVLRLLAKNGSTIEVISNGQPLYSDAGRPNQFLFALREHRLEDELRNRHEAERRLLEICHTSKSIQGLMQNVVAFFKNFSGCRAIGIRLADHEDFPYYSTTGFPERFVRLESSLCCYDLNGNILRDRIGNPVLECMCGNVLRGRFDPRQPFFSEKGSFWTNSTSKLLAGTTEEDRQSRTRNRCNGEGYESVALIPIRLGGVCHGLIQFNDYECDRFTLEQIMALELLADHLGLAVAKLMTDERLRVSEEHYRLIFDNSLEAIVIAQDGKIIKANAAHEELTGYSEAEIVDKEFGGRIHPDDREMVSENHRRRLHGERVERRYTFRLICKSGRIKYVEQHGSVIDWGGKPATLNFLIDISEQRLAQDALRRQKETLQAIIDASPEAIYLIDRNGTLEMTNEAMRVKWKMRARELAGKNVYEILPPQAVLARKEYNQRVIESGLPGFVEYELDGSFYQTHIRPVFDEKGKVGQLAVFAADITAQKRVIVALEKSEYRFKTMIDNSPAGIFLVRDGRYRYANAAGKKMLGYQEMEDVINMSIEERLDPTQIGQLRQRNLRAWAGKANPPMELLVHRPDGVEVITESISTPIELHDGPAIMVIGTDITDRKKNEELLKASLRLSEEVDRLDTTGLLTMAIDEAEMLTGSSIGFFHFLEPDGNTLTLQAWSTKTSKQFCRASGTGLHYDFEKAGVWADAVRKCKPVIHNDYSKLKGRKGMPPGHADVQRELVVPVIRGGKVVAILGVGNKIAPYGRSDVELIKNLANVSWDIILRKKAEVVLRKSLAEKEVLIREVHHRVKNNLAAVIGLFDLHRKNIADPKAADILRELSGRVRAMSLVHEKLYRSENLAAIRMHEYFDALISHLRTAMGRRDISCHIAHHDQELPLDLAVPCGMIVNELVTNALKYAFPSDAMSERREAEKPVIEITLKSEVPGRMCLSIADNGQGLPADFDLRRVDTLGMVLVRMLGEHQLGGAYSVHSENGVTFRLDFPLQQKENSDE